MKKKENNFFKEGKNTLKNGEVITIDKVTLDSLKHSFTNTKYPEKLYKDISKSKKDFREYLLFLKSINEASVVNSTKRGARRGAAIGSFIGGVGGGALGATGGAGLAAAQYLPGTVGNVYKKIRGKKIDPNVTVKDYGSFKTTQKPNPVGNSWNYIKNGYHVGATTGSLIGATSGAVYGGTAGAGIQLGKNAYNIVRNGIRYKDGKPLVAPRGDRNRGFVGFDSAGKRPVGRPSGPPKPKPVKYIMKNGAWEPLKGRPPKGAQIKTVYEEERTNQMTRIRLMEFVYGEEYLEEGLGRELVKGAVQGGGKGAKRGAAIGALSGGALGATGGGIVGHALKNTLNTSATAGAIGGGIHGSVLGGAAGTALGTGIGAVGGAAKAGYRHFFPKKDKNEANTKANPVGRPKKNNNGRPRKFNESIVDESVWGATKSTLKGAGKGAAVGGAIGGALGASTTRNLGGNAAQTTGGGIGGAALGAVPGAVIGAARGLHAHFRKQDEEKNKSKPAQKPLGRPRRRLSEYLQEQEDDISEGKTWDRFKQAAKDGWKDGNEKTEKWAKKHNLPTTFKQAVKQGSETGERIGTKLGTKLARKKKISEGSLNLQIGSPALDANVKDTRPDVLEIIKKRRLKNETTD